MGRNGGKEISGQADLGLTLSGLADFLTEDMFNVDYCTEDMGIHIKIQYVCSCSHPVVSSSLEGNFYCPHCDKHCEIGIPDCPRCAYAMMDKPHQLDYDHEYPEEDLD